MSDPAPFISNAEYLACESDWLRQRADAIAARQESLGERSYGRRWNQHPTEDEDSWTCKVSRLQATAAATRERIDARLAAGSPCGGFKLGLDKLQIDHKLSKFERMVLLVCTLTAIDQRVTCALECLDGVSWTTTPDVMFLIAKKGFADRLKFREFFGPDNALIRNGLIQWTQEKPDLLCLTTSSFQITPWAFDLLIGHQI